MVASVKRLHNNVIAIEGAFVEEEAPVAEPTIELVCLKTGYCGNDSDE